MIPTLTITSTENAVTASSHVEDECRCQRYVSNDMGAINRKAQTDRARKCRLPDGFRAALSDISIGDTILCKKCNNAVESNHKFRQRRTKRFSEDNDVRPV